MSAVEVESLGYGPHGIVRIDGKACFVRHVAPGDVVEVEIREDHGSYAFGEVSRLVRPGSSRRSPPCPYLPRCGGCPWQQVDYPAQLAAKETVVRELLTRVGGIENPPVLPIIGSRQELGYRRRLSLRVENRQIGYFAAASHDLVPVAECLLGAPDLENAIALAQDWIAGLRTKVKRLEIVASGMREQVVFVGQAEGELAGGDARSTEDCLRTNPRVAGAVLYGRRWRRVWGNDTVRVSLFDGGDATLHAGNFAQVNEGGNRAMIETVLQFAQCASEQRVIDLYAGAGNLSLPLALRVAHVTAVERVAASANDGRAIARRLSLDNVSFIAADAAEVLDGWVKQGRRADTVVLDPPRSGAAPVMSRLLQLAPLRVVYVSCNPATLARDLKLLAPRYRVHRVQPIDFFPQTYHVEAVAELILGKSGEEPARRLCP